MLHLILIKYSKNKKEGGYDRKLSSFHHYVYLPYHFTWSRYSNGYEKYIVAGKVGGVKTVFGTCIALLIHTLAAVIGLSALIVKSAFIFYFQVRWGSLFNIYRY